jgi:hypothetical protein
MDICGMNQDYDEATNCIYYNMSFATLNQLSPIEPRFLDRLRRPFHRLTINNPRTRMLIPTQFFSDMLTDFGINLLQNVMINPLVIVVADQGRRGKAFR